MMMTRTCPWKRLWSERLPPKKIKNKHCSFFPTPPPFLYQTKVAEHMSAPPAAPHSNSSNDGRVQGTDGPTDASRAFKGTDAPHPWKHRRSPLPQMVVGTVSVLALVMALPAGVSSRLAEMPEVPFLYMAQLIASLAGLRYLFRPGSTPKAFRRTILITLAIWCVAQTSNTISVIHYWNLGWLCNVSHSTRGSCYHQNVGVVCMWIASTVLWIAALPAIVALVMALYQEQTLRAAGRKGE